MLALEKIYKDFVGLKATESLRHTDTSLVYTSRRTEVKAGSGKARVPYRPKFPSNTGNLIPHPIYSKMKTWFDEMSNLKAEQEPSFAANFKLKHQAPKTLIKTKTVYKTSRSQEPSQKRTYQPKKTVDFCSNRGTERTTRRRKR